MRAETLHDIQFFWYTENPSSVGIIVQDNNGDNDEDAFVLLWLARAANVK